jgi:PIN domain nuclease of toxin-antitoxin system
VKLLLDTHVVIRWIVEPKRLSKGQFRALEQSIEMQEPVGVSAMTLLEITLLSMVPRLRAKPGTEELLLRELQSNQIFQILPLTFEIVREVSKIGKTLRDPADRVITATALVHGLRLLTSDQQIINSGLVPTID